MSAIITCSDMKFLLVRLKKEFQGNTIHNCADKFLLADLDDLSLLRLLNFPLLLLFDSPHDIGRKIKVSYSTMVNRQCVFWIASLSTWIF